MMPIQQVLKNSNIDNLLGLQIYNGSDMGNTSASWLCRFFIFEDWNMNSFTNKKSDIRLKVL